MEVPFVPDTFILPTPLFFLGTFLLPFYSSGIFIPPFILISQKTILASEPNPSHHALTFKDFLFSVLPVADIGR